MLHATSKNKETITLLRGNLLLVESKLPEVPINRKSLLLTINHYDPTIYISEYKCLCNLGWDFS